jgi:hypothetical protein
VAVVLWLVEPAEAAVGPVVLAGAVEVVLLAALVGAEATG